MLSTDHDQALLLHQLSNEHVLQLPCEISKSATEESLNQHGDEDTLDGNTDDDGLGGCNPGLERVEPQRSEEYTTMNGVETDLQRIERLLLDG